ncbi:ABC transporter ATP-binding protein [Qingshengfaniella alkalisoli]|uniref:ABC transporter ATP-binding protein n=1 Tax=Qingshengfaniella alkalisoli TaxID=2599296 RepID=A0A5B8J3K4_9RHOB|nr:ABC transporter ATP-binding protein [Qingshengfaniella alkalisoli]QDY69077.1 ABC transporter ATP-binding protein [Qingshengfaniella alkalisoli]
MSTLLKLENVTKTFGGLTAVNDMSFEIGQGEVVGLLGPNGSGKTTLLNLISGALPASAGAIRIGGSDLAGKRPDVIAAHGVARTFQLVKVLPSLTILENVMVPAAFGRSRLWGAALEDHARDCLAKVGLTAEETLHAGDLTYIDQKRLELARALAAEPELLLLDEWLAGLNPTELREGIALIRSLEGHGMTILLVEHIMDAIRALCPRCVVMAAGTKIADGPTAEVLVDPQVIAAYLGTADA